MSQLGLSSMKSLTQENAVDLKSFGRVLKLATMVGGNLRYSKKNVTLYDGTT